MKKILTAAITPLTESMEIDEKSLERMLNRNLRHGIDGFFLLGTMGEGIVLNKEQKKQLVHAACGIIGEKADILVGIGDTGLNRIFDNMEQISADSYTHYALCLPNFGGLVLKDPVSFILAVADKADRPVYFYYNPLANNVQMTPSQFREIFTHPNIVGVKNSASNMYIRKELLLLKDELNFEVFEGQEWAIDEALILGCDGALCGCGTLASKIMKGVANAVDKHDYEEAILLQKKLIRLYHVVFGGNIEHCCIGQKYALHLLGILDSYSCLYHTNMSLTDVQKKSIADGLEQFREDLD